MELSFNVRQLEHTHQLAKTFALFYQQNQTQFKKMNVPVIVNFEGDLGAGKTEFCRCFIQNISPETAVVNSPTFNIVNTYLNFMFHVDCYRLNDSEELEYLTMREYMLAGNVFLVEWASKVGYFFYPPFIQITIYYNKENRLLNLLFPETKYHLTKQLQQKLHKCLSQLAL